LATSAERHTIGNALEPRAEIIALDRRYAHNNE